MNSRNGIGSGIRFHICSKVRKWKAKSCPIQTLLSRLNNSILWRTANRTIFPSDCFIFLKIYGNVECLSDFISVADAVATLVVFMWRFSRFWPQCEKNVFYTRKPFCDLMYEKNSSSVLLLLIKLTEICLIWHKSITFFSLPVCACVCFCFVLSSFCL